MIERYSRAAMRNIFSDENKFKTYLKVELEAAKAFNKLGIIPNDDINKILEKASFNLERIYELEEITKHDVVAFTRAVSESLGAERKWIHYGLTSTDVVDTAYGCLYKEANIIIRNDLLNFLEVLKEKALLYKNTPCIGRTHGIHADISAFGLKFALYYEEIKRSLERFDFARSYVECGKLSGAVGNFSNIDPFIEEEVCKNLGINHANISTQVLQRDRHASYLSSIALIASVLEQIATEVRGLQRTEIHEAEEYFSKDQKGSSAMPHKRNPIGSENICGCARVIRGYMVTAFEDVALWHERDISHSSVERIIIPDTLMLIDYMLNRITNIIKNLVVYEDQMMKNIYLTNKVIFAQRVMNALINKGLSRENAYDLVQPLSMKAYNLNLDYQEVLASSKDINNYLSKEELDSCFTLDYYLKNVDYIYKRIKILN